MSKGVKTDVQPSALFKEKAAEAIRMWNAENPETPIGTGVNWSNVGNELTETFINKYLFPKINETSLIRCVMNDRFDWMTKEIPVISQFNEEYVYTDIVPTFLRLDDDEMLNLRRNYAKMRTKLFTQGNYFKYKYTLNNNDNRLNWSTMGDAIKSMHGIYKNVIDSFNIYNEKAKKATIVDYFLTNVKYTEKVSTRDELARRIVVAMLNMQDKTTDYNETDMASGDRLTQKTLSSNLEDMLIITDTETKEYLLNSVVANTFNMSGLDITSHVMSFKDLGGSWKTTKSITITAPETISKFTAMGHWDMKNGVGLTVPAGSVFTFDVSGLAEFKDKVEEIKPKSDICAMILDVNATRFRRNTKGMMKKPIYLQESDDWQHMMMFYMSNNISPFANKAFLYNNDEDVANNIYNNSPFANKPFLYNNDEDVANNIYNK